MLEGLRAFVRSTTRSKIAKMRAAVIEACGCVRCGWKVVAVLILNLIREDARTSSSYVPGPFANLFKLVA